VTPLLDTHVLIWLALEPKRLSKEARRLIERARAKDGLSIASITLWEIATLVTRGRIAVQGTVANWTTQLLATTGVAVLELTPAIAEISTTFGPDYSKDPADQIIGATARAHGLPLITADTRLLECPLLKCVW
jgi:PIN domain nuclease of toxin-antitoxin system